MEVTILFVIFFVLLFLGAPIAIAIGISTFSITFLEPAVGMLSLIQRTFVLMESIPLLAIAFFITTGYFMIYSGAMKGLIELASVFVGHLHGGLAQISIVTSMLFAGISGSSVADASGIGSMLIPAMIESGYDAPFSAAINAESATLGVIIPPSIPMIVYAIASQQSIGILFLTTAIPGIVFALSSMVVTHIIAKKRNYPRSKRPPLKEAIKIIVKNIPVILLPGIILVPLIVGWATVTEVSAISAIYALLLGLVNRKLNIKKIVSSLTQAAILAGIIMLIAGMSNAFAWMLTYYKVPDLIGGILLNITDNPKLILLLMVLFLWVIGIFIDFLPALLMFTPLYLRLAEIVGITPIHLGAILIVNLALGMCTPPVASLLLVSSKIAKTSIEKTTLAILPYYLVIMTIGLLVTFYEPFVTWLPSLLKVL